MWVAPRPGKIPRGNRDACGRRTEKDEAGMSMEPIVAVEIGTNRVRVFVGEAREDGALMITAVGDAASSGMR